MILNYLALAILLIGITLVIYTVIYIHDIPYHIAKKRNHPQKEVIHVASWLSLLMLHALWPFLFMWAVWRPAPAVPVESDGQGNEPSGPVPNRLEELEKRVRQLESSLPEEKRA